MAMIVHQRHVPWQLHRRTGVAFSKVTLAYFLVLWGKRTEDLLPPSVCVSECFCLCDQFNAENSHQERVVVTRLSPFTIHIEPKYLALISWYIQDCQRVGRNAINFNTFVLYTHLLTYHYVWRQIPVVWNVTLCSLVGAVLQELTASIFSIEKVFFFFYPKDGGSRLLRILGACLSNYAA